jgi:hypothetical protein
MQNLKAVTMGVVTAIALFWSNKPNPAIGRALTWLHGDFYDLRAHL